MATDRRIDFDAVEVAAALRAAVVQGWTVVSALTPAETVYGLMLYEGAEYGYVCVTPFTEEALDRVVADYRRGRWGASYQGVVGREKLRWSAPDSPYHVAAEVSSPPLIDGEEQYRLWKMWERDDRPLSTYRSAIRELCFETLLSLDAEGFFGPHREQVALQVVSRNGEESTDELHAMTQRLNPPSVVERYRRHLDDLRSE